MPVPLGGKLELCGDLVCRGRASCLGKKYGALLGAGFVCGGEKKQPQHPLTHTQKTKKIEL